MNILILGARAPVALEWVRLLAATGHKLHAADSLRFPITRFSRHVQRYHLLPAPNASPHEWGRKLSNLIKQYSIELVIPTCEEAFHLALERHQLPLSCRLLVDRPALLNSLHHKGLFATLIQGWPLCAPESYILESTADVALFMTNSSAYVFKPCYSRFATQTLICPQPHELQAVVPTPTQPWLAQRHIEGIEHCSYSLLDQGRLLAHTCYQPKYRAGQGAGVFLEPAAPPEIENFVAHFGRQTQYTGQVGFDFIRDQDGIFHVLESNPRGTSGLHLLAQQPQKLVDRLEGREGDIIRQPSTPRMMAIGMLLFALPRAGLFNRAFWRDFWHTPDVLFRASDPLPALGQIISLTELAWYSWHTGRSLLTSSTGDIEWDGSNT